MTVRVTQTIREIWPGASSASCSSWLAALLGNASIEERSEGTVRRVGTAVAPVAVPDYLENPRRATVRATVRDDGYIPHVSVRNGASLDGENISVTQDVYWLSRADPVVTPGWYKRETGGER